MFSSVAFAPREYEPYTMSSSGISHLIVDDPRYDPSFAIDEIINMFHCILLKDILTDEQWARLE